MQKSDQRFVPQRSERQKGTALRIIFLFKMKGVDFTKKLFSILLCMLFTVMCAVPASANSGPSRWEQGPAYGMTPVKNCPVTVEKEDLTFQVSDKSFSYSKTSARVTAAYQMKNPTSNSMNVEMAFPLISSYKQLVVNSGVKITAGGKELPYTVCLTGPLPQFGTAQLLYDDNGKLDTSSLPNFTTLLKNAVPIPTTPKYIETEHAVLYEVKHTTDCFLRAEMSASASKTHLISFDGEISRSGDKVTITGWSYDKQDSFSFLVIGENPQDIKITAFDTTDKTKKLKIEPQFTISQASPIELCHKYIRKYSEIDPNDQSIVIRYLDSLLQRDGICDVAQANDLISKNCIYLLNYTVPFAANSEEQVSVSYTTIPTMSNPDNSINTFAYISNPAKNWASFQNLNITVIPPSKDYTLASSTIDLKADTNGNYTANLAALPQDDIAFALHRGNVEFSIHSFSWWLLAAGIILISIIFLAIWMYHKKHHKTNI